MKKTLDMPIWLKKSLGALFWLALWWIISLIINKELLVPSPAQAVAVLGTLLVQPAFWYAAALSMLRILLGFALAALLG
ncbi:MAG: hypothetical protein IKK30_06475, partial [Clostridia bacterium]|nr:hypothetical protein [Clostridia bacterium]